MGSSAWNTLEAEFSRYAETLLLLELFDSAISPFSLFMTDDTSNLQHLLEEAGDYVQDETKGFIAKLFGEPLGELGGLIADQVRLWRFKRFCQIAEKAEKHVKQKGISPKAIPLKLLLPIAEKSSLEDEDSELNSKWVGLLASAASGELIHPSYSTILAELTPEEAQILDAIYRWHSTQPEWSKLYESTNLLGKDFLLKDFQEGLDVTEDRIKTIADNLFRLRICQPALIPHFLGAFDPRFVGFEPYKAIYLTKLGYDFIKTCHGP